MKKVLDTGMIIINNRPYRVTDLNNGIVNGFELGTAYKVENFFIKLVLPFIESLPNFKHLHEKKTPGIYFNENRKVYQIKYPAIKEHKKYSYSQIKGITANTLFDNVVFHDIEISEVDGERFKPEIHEDDDPNNKVFKTGICLKNIVFDAYGQKFNALDIPGASGSNSRNNSKRAIINNRSLSSNKLAQYNEIFEFDYAILLRDAPNARHPMFKDCEAGKCIAYFSNGEFDTSSYINIDTIEPKSLYGIKSDDD